MNKQHNEKGGSAGTKGSQFQVRLLVLFLLNALRMRLPNWRLSTEDKRAGKFDDVVLEWAEGAVVLQAKHKEYKKRIAVEQLMATTPRNDDFSIAKYFLSYQEIRDKFPSLRKAVICTNASVNGKALAFLEAQADSSDSILLCKGDTRAFYTLKDDILSELKEKIKTYYSLKFKDKEVDESIITDENLQNFQTHFQIYFEYPSGDNLENIIEHLLDGTSWRGKVTASEIYLKVMNWFQGDKRHCLTELHLKAMGCEIRRDKHWQSLKQYDVCFANNDLNFADSNKMYHFIVERSCLLQEIRIWQALHDMRKKALYIHPDDNMEDQKQLIEAFGLEYFVVLILVQPSESVVMQMWDQIEKILNKSTYKKIILLTARNNELVRLIKSSNNSFVVTKEPPTLDDLLEDAGDRLLKSKKIVFQGHSINLEELFAPESIRKCSASVGSEILERLVEGEQIRVGSEVRVLDEEVERSYIPRNFVRKNELRHEGNILEANDRLVLIADKPGMGKTTTLTKLAVLIKESSPHLWVCKIILDNYSKFLKYSLRKRKTAIDIMEFLDSQEGTRLTNELDKLIFSVDKKVVLMLDAVDEISPDYTELVESLLSNCLRKNNFFKIFATTRLHLVEMLEKKFQVKSFVLEPFSQRNQIEFLRRQWLRNLGHSDREKCEQYARALVSRMSSWTNSNFRYENDFAAIPLQIKMVAEIFQENGRNEGIEDWEGCKEFLNADRLQPKLTEKIDLIRLYKLFMEKKRDVFIEKFNPTESLGADQALTDQFEESLAFHRTLSLKIIFDDEKICHFFSCYQEGAKICKTNSLKVGIIQETDNILCFVHRTFAEYFVAECLLMELQRQNKNTKFQKLFVDEVLRRTEFKVICTFLDGLLQDSVDSLPANIFQNYQRLSYNMNSFYPHDICLIHSLERNGCIAILRLVLKCINFKIIEGKETSVSCGFVRRHFGNRLNILQYFTQRGGINIKDWLDRSPLDIAIIKGDLEMVKFLVKQGANINTTDSKQNPLHEAVSMGHSAIVEFLVEQGADVIENVRQGGSTLYKAISNNNVHIVNYLLDKIIEGVNNLKCGLDAEYAMVPFAAGYLGRMDIIKFLVESGIDTNTRIGNEQSLVFGAAMGGQFEAVKYLMEQGTDITSRDANGNTVLHLIAKNSPHTYMFKHFLDLGIHIDVKNRYWETPLHVAVKEGTVEMVEFLIRSGADVNSKNKFEGLSVVHTAALMDRLDILELLTEHGADVNVKNIAGNTILHTVIAKLMNLNVINRLVELGIDVTIEDEKGHTALHVALLERRLDVAKYLVEYSIDINSKHRDGQTYLHFVVSTMYNNAGYILNDIFNTSFHDFSLDRLDIVKHFVEHDAEVNLRNNEGQTILHLAILSAVFNCRNSSCNDCLLVVKLLIERGAAIGIEGSIEDAKFKLAKEIQRHVRSRWKRLKTILQLPVFSLLDSALPLAAPSTSVWVAERSEVAPNTDEKEEPPIQLASGVERSRSVGIMKSFRKYFKK